MLLRLRYIGLEHPDPFRLHWPCTGTALSAHDYPIDSAKIEFSNRTYQRLYREKAHTGRRLLKVPNPGFLCSIFDREPHMIRAARVSVALAQEVTHERRRLGEYLVGMPLRAFHVIEDPGDEFLWDPLVKEMLMEFTKIILGVRHRIG